MDQESFDSERPPDEAWWERELHRNEKLMDKYMAVLGDNPDWDKWQNPDDLYNKVHFGIDPPMRESVEAEEPASDAVSKEGNEGEEESFDVAEEAEEAEEDWDDPRQNAEVNGNYQAISAQARRFALAVFNLENVPGNAEVLCLSAGKVGANLAGGHGLGYDDDSICGNVVKCRWALSDCEFCREMLEQMHDKTRDSHYGELAAEAAKLSELIRDRIASLRKRVWW